MFKNIIDEISPAKKAWETMRQKSPAKKAWDTMRRQKGAQIGAQKIQKNQWEQEKIDHLYILESKTKKEACIVCSDNRKKVLQDHHIKPDDSHTVKLCANCHDVVRRGTLNDLIEINYPKEDPLDNLIDSAFKVAVIAHQNQTKKGTNIPYIVHPISVAQILLQAGFPEEIIAAGILHDTVEDTKVTLDFIRDRFGDRVADIVNGCSEPDKSLPWKERKMHTIEFLKTASLEVRIVACADKLLNIRTIASDYEKIGDKLWERFTETRKEEHEWYYIGVAASLCEQPGTKDMAIFQQLNKEVETFFDKIKKDNRIG
ncbi:MAG TPA: HD domain-containing protein [Candidatus Methanoperedens sp.]|nr:HD domain-containing protein [Candidatus Methanoperedens sp.]